jgi:hypothetical protein
MDYRRTLLLDNFVALASLRDVTHRLSPINSSMIIEEVVLKAVFGRPDFFFVNNTFAPTQTLYSI